MIQIQSLVRQNIIDLSPYSSARKTLNLNKIISLDANENPYGQLRICLLYTSPSPRDATLSRMPSSA